MDAHSLRAHAVVLSILFKTFGIDMTPRRRVFIVGGAITPFIGKFHPDFIWKGHADFGERENPTIEEHLTRAITEAFTDAKIEGSVIERAYVGNFAGGLFANQLHMGSLAARVDGLDGKPISRVEGACASGSMAIVSAIESLQAGHDIALAAGAEIQTSRSARDGAEFLARASHYETERDLDAFAFPALFARRAKEYFSKYNIGHEDLGHVVMKAFSNANKNPNAHMHAIEVDWETATTANKRNAEFLSNPEFREYLRVLECSPVSDGGAAIVLATEDGLKKLGRTSEGLTEITSWSQRTGALGRTPERTRLVEAGHTAREALTDSKITLDDIGVAEVHDCFAIAEVLMMEAIGLAPEGEGIKPIRDGVTAIDGRLPVNTGGGLIGFGHPIGATGIKQVLEVQRQLDGECGAYQIPHTATHGLTVNMGGDDRTVVSMVMRKA